MDLSKLLMYRLIAIAGTFDRLHKGHRFFISEAFKLGKKVIIGLTSDTFVEEKFKIQNSQPKADRPRAEKFKINVNNYEMRKKELEEFLTQEKLLDRAEIVKIDDVYGPAIGKTEIEALVVTKETLEGARLVNKKRKRLGLSPLKILQVPLIPADDRRRIASTRIRLGEIDRWGRVFNKIFNFQFSIFKISDKLRLELKKPQGLLLKGDPQSPSDVVTELQKIVRQLQPVMVITVGDEVTRLCNQMGLTPHLSVVDYKVNRRKIYNTLSDLGFKSTFARPGLANGIRTVRNPAGNITRSLTYTIYQAIKKIIANGEQQIIRVLGEEDLAGVPAILLSPLGSIVLYGQPASVQKEVSGLRRGKPESGVVVVEVTEEKKGNLLRLIELD